MTTTAHERALEEAYKKFLKTWNTEGYGEKSATADACKAYLQALLDDAETAEALKENIRSKAWEREIPVNTPNGVVMVKESKYTYNDIVDELVATLKRMGGV